MRPRAMPTPQIKQRTWIGRPIARRHSLSPTHAVHVDGVRHVERRRASAKVCKVDPLLPQRRRTYCVRKMTRQTSAPRERPYHVGSGSEPAVKLVHHLSEEVFLSQLDDPHLPPGVLDRIAGVRGVHHHTLTKFAPD